MRAADRPPLHISAHATFRWLERTGSIDVPALQRTLSMALDRAYQAAAAMGSTDFLILQGGLVYVVRSGTLVTVLHEDGRHKHAHSLRKQLEDDGC